MNRLSVAIGLLLSLLALLLPAEALAVELREAELMAGASPVLQNASGTVRLEDARLGGAGPTFFVPEPGGLWQLLHGAGLLTVLARRRRGRLPSQGCAEEIL